MNICFITGTYHPKIGGAETYVKTIAEGLAALNHNVILITDGLNVNTSKVEVLNGVKVVRALDYWNDVNDPTKVRWEQMYFSLLSDIKTILQNERVDIIHTNSLDTALLGIMISQSIGTPLVCSFHEQEPEMDPFGEGKCKLVFSNDLVNKFIAGSDFYYQKALTFGANPNKAELIYHGIDTDFFSKKDKFEAKSYFNVDLSSPLVVSAARLKERKGLLELIKAISEVKRTIPDIKLVIAGSRNSASDAYAQSLYNKIQHLELNDNVTIMENLSFKDMPNLFSAADVVVQPSHAEGLGLSLLEAMCIGKPVIGTDIVGFREILVHESNGIMIPPKNVSAISNEIIRLLTDQHLKDCLSKSARIYVQENFDIKNTILKTLDIYEDLLKEYTVVK